MPRRSARFYILNSRGEPIRDDGTASHAVDYRPGQGAALYFNRLDKAVAAAKKLNGVVVKRDATRSHYGHWHGADTFSPLTRTSKRISFLKKNPRRRKTKYRVRKNYKRFGKARRRARRSRRSR